MTVIGLSVRLTQYFGAFPVSTPLTVGEPQRYFENTTVYPNFQSDKQRASLPCTYSPKGSGLGQRSAEYTLTETAEELVVFTRPPTAETRRARRALGSRAVIGAPGRTTRFPFRAAEFGVKQVRRP